MSMLKNLLMPLLGLLLMLLLGGCIAGLSGSTWATAPQGEYDKEIGVKSALYIKSVAKPKDGTIGPMESKTGFNFTGSLTEETIGGIADDEE